MPKVEGQPQHKQVIIKSTESLEKKVYDWWNAGSKKELSDRLLTTVSFLKERNQAAYRQASIYATLYGNLPLANWAGVNLTRINTNGKMPTDRPTMSVITSCVDTIVSRMTQNKPRPVFLTDNGDYKQRTLAKQMNRFIQGEFYQTKAYQLGEAAFRDACVLGTGALKVLEDDRQRVCLERRLKTEILMDSNDALYGSPRSLYEIMLIDRNVLCQRFPEYASLIQKAQSAVIDTSPDSQQTVSDLVMVAEGWHLRSGPNADDGLHVVCCSEGILFEESYKKSKFPFAFTHYAPRLLGFFGQGLPERQLGTQIEINKLLITISRSINLMGVPRIFVEKGSKTPKASFNNEIGAIIEFSGAPPIFSVAECIAPEIYQQLQRLVMYAYEQEGISQLSATSQKPAGLNSGEAIRSYDDIQSDRFAALQKRYQDFYTDLAYLIIDKAVDIAERDGKYMTIFPDKDGTKEINLPQFKNLEDDPFVIQCYDTSSLPKDPAGRLEKVVEMMTAQIISPQEGRRLLDYPDIEQVDQLANAGEERILKILDEIVEDGKYTAPDSFIDIDLAMQLTTQYYNRYVPAKLEESRADMLRSFFDQLQAQKQMMTEAIQQQAMQQQLMQQAMMPQPQGQQQQQPQPAQMPGAQANPLAQISG